MKEEMFLESASGFSMPYEATEDVNIILGYGSQTHPNTGKEFHHCGIDLAAANVPLLSVASGTVVGVGSDAVHENYIICRYGKYEVRYGHVSAAYKPYGTPLTAGEVIARSGDFLHLDVRFDGQEINPIDFLAVIYANLELLGSLGMKGTMDSAPAVEVTTPYDKDETEIVSLMLHYLPLYMQDLQSGAYVLPRESEVRLQNIFAQGGERGYFFEQLPSYVNPLGLGVRSTPLMSRVQTQLISDFLNYMAVRHNIFLQGTSESQKKKWLKKRGATES